MGISARDRVCLFTNCRQIDLAGRSFARRDERIRSCEPDRNRNSTVAVTSRGTGFRPDTIMHLWRDSVAKAAARRGRLNHTVRQVVILTIEHRWSVGCGSGGVPYRKCADDFWIEE